MNRPFSSIFTNQVAMHVKHPRLYAAQRHQFYVTWSIFLFFASSYGTCSLEL
jgi:hypothetical protein